MPSLGGGALLLLLIASEAEAGEAAAKGAFIDPARDSAADRDTAATTGRHAQFTRIEMIATGQFDPAFMSLVKC